MLHAWHMPVAHSLRHPDGSFAGAVVADWRVSAITDLFLATDLGAHPLMELVGTQDGRLRAIAGREAGTPGEDIGASELFAMLRASPDNVWIGRSALHNVVRMHAFRSIAGRDLAVVVGVDYDEAMAPVHAWAFEAKLFAGGISVLIMLMAGILSVNAVQGRNRKAAQDFDRTMLTATHSQLEVARSHADAAAARLEATLQGMSDGVAIMDRAAPPGAMEPAVPGHRRRAARVFCGSACRWRTSCARRRGPASSARPTSKPRWRGA